MSDTRTDVPTETVPDLLDRSGDPAARAHIVCKRDLPEAIIFGLEVEALCGYRWVPGADPAPLPMCEGCHAAAMRGEPACR